MTSSRTHNNAKVLAKHQRQQKAKSGKTLASQFTKKQSSFERRREEQHVTALQQQHDGSLLDTSSTSGAGRGEGFQLSSKGVPALGLHGTAAAGLFSSRLVGEAHKASGDGGWGRSVATPTPPSLVTGSAMRSGRAERRRQRCQLEEEPLSSLPHTEAPPAGGGLLSSKRVVFEEDLLAAPQAESIAAAAKEERFREVISNSRHHRAEKQRDRSDREAESVALDKEFESLMHLLPQRDRREEERRAFQQSGTPEVRALLQAYKKRRGKHARQLVVRTTKEIVPADARTTSADGSAHDETKTTPTHSTPASEPVVRIRDVSYVTPLAEANQKGGGPSRPLKLDAEDLRRLDELRTFAERAEASGRQGAMKKRPRGEDEGSAETSASEMVEAEDSDDIDGIARLEAAKAKAFASPIGEGADHTSGMTEDAFDFDRTLHLFLQDPRRAHPAQRSLTEEEEVAAEAERMRLQLDRAAVPLEVREGLEREDQLQRTRREWVERGGDQPFHMHGGAVDDDDGISLSSLEEESEEEEGEEAGATRLTREKKAKDEHASLTGSVELDKMLAAMEALANKAPLSEESDGTCSTFHALLCRMHRFGQQHPVALAKMFRTLLVEAERRSLKHRVPDKALTLSLFAITFLFPLTDYRHPVTTPLLLYLTSAVLQLRLQDRRAVKALVLFAALLTHCAVKAEGQKFFPEAPTALFNLIALQLPQALLRKEGSRLQAVTVPFPLLHRGGTQRLAANAHSNSAVRTLVGGGANAADGTSEETQRYSDDLQPILSGCGGGDTIAELPQQDDPAWAALRHQKSTVRVLSLAEGASSRSGVECPVEQRAEEEESWLCAGYALLQELATAYQHMAAFPALFLHPFEVLHAKLVGNTSSPDNDAAQRLRFVWSPSALLRRFHDETLQHLRTLAAAQISKRTPLAMRTFRPRPLRQFDPLLEEREEIAVKSEIRELKQTVREDRKRVLRHVQAEATVTRRAREREAAMRDKDRETRYRQVVGQLQQQQHMMNTVDAAMQRGKKKMKKGISGAPGSSGDGDGVPEY